MNKICTSKEQSEKLIGFGIDINSADMYYSYDYNIDEYEDDAQIIPQSEDGQHFSLFLEDIPAWSLTALLNVLPSSTLDSSNDHYYRLRCIERFTEWRNNPVDACYEMIVKLHELKIL